MAGKAIEREDRMEDRGLEDMKRDAKGYLKEGFYETNFVTEQLAQDVLVLAEENKQLNLVGQGYALSEIGYKQQIADLQRQLAEAREESEKKDRQIDSLAGLAAKHLKTFTKEEMITVSRMWVEEASAKAVSDE